MPNSIFPKGDRDVIKLLEKFGGWERVLDPSFEPPKELYVELEAAGYPRTRLDKMRREEGQPEKDAWIHRIAYCFYQWWRASHSSRVQWSGWPGYPGLTPGVRWQDYPNDGSCWKMFAEPMTRLAISRDDIDQWIESHPERCPAFGIKEKSTAVTFERFSEKALKVIMLAQEETRRIGHNWLGTEQILLGLIGEGEARGAKALKSVGVNLKETRVEVEKIISRGSRLVPIGIPLTPRAKRVLQYTCEEADKLQQEKVGTEHLLLGLIREANESRTQESQGVAYRVLRNLKVDLDVLQIKVLDLINGEI